MPYLKNVDTSAKVGFRPYYQTDAFGAAHLSGYGSGLGSEPAHLGQNHPFKPQAWHLHGVDGSFLGTYHLNRPFDPWELYDDVHHTAGVHGLSGLGTGADPTAAAADELLSAGHITQAEHDAILEGSMGFADVLGYDPTDQSSWQSLTSLFQEVNQDLQALEAQFAAAAPQHSGDAAFAQLGRDLIAKRTQYTDLASQFVHYYTLVMGSTPSGLAGLGIAPLVYWVAGAAVFIVGAFIALYALRDWSKSIDVRAVQAQTQQTAATSTAATNQTLLQRLAAAQAAGDTLTAQAILKTLQTTAAQTAAPSTAEQWLMANAKWLALGAAGLIAIGPISQGLFGGKRR
jgi:hypothetical protein